ncbi:Cytochrome P450 84A1 [Acorus calamus]|uniref:Cytochrome P450 84A1 n=1 Tax=Acorus calamus TaxID=4465 RepID=A0AAV9D580_ACOCL|nr:Cytochrome P450 84A1 [Acorus calamus]
MMGNLPHRALQKLAAVHGPIMHLRLGLTDAVVITSPEAARLVLRTHDEIFTSRPPLEAARHFSHGGRDVASAEYGPHWRAARKFSTLHLLGHHKVESFKSVREEELRALVLSLRGARGRKVDVTHGLRRRMRSSKARLDAFLDRIIEDHLEITDEALKKDFMGTMLSLMGTERPETTTDFPIDRTIVAAISLNMLVGMMDTSTIVAEWAMTELLRHPNVMKAAQEELARVVGLDRAVTESDLPNLPYLKMVLMDSLRLHPAAPFLAYSSTEECVIGGYRIPAKSFVIVNVWAIERDPEVWPDPERFDPERFASGDVDVRGQDFGLLPFGSGRRGCPGMQVAMTWFGLVMGQLLHCFEWELPEGVEARGLDMTEKFGLAVPRASHLWAVPTYRLSCA